MTSVVLRPAHSSNCRESVVSRGIALEILHGKPHCQKRRATLLPSQSLFAHQRGAALHLAQDHLKDTVSLSPKFRDESLLVFQRRATYSMHALGQVASYFTHCWCPAGLEIS
ncbi:TPA: hypothetical protein ACH3X2_001219 [Trebouxia sp. C0005]